VVLTWPFLAILPNFVGIAHLMLFTMHTYDTVSEAVNGLKERGYSIDFNKEYDCLVCNKARLSLKPEEFEIAEFHRFEGNSDPADEAVVYAIESKHGEKGILVDGFGPSSDAVSETLIEKLTLRH
jgi:hypothetical protein